MPVPALALAPNEAVNIDSAPAIIHPSGALPDAVLSQLFLGARTHSAWSNQPVDDALLERIYELTRMPPTAANNQPLRVVFVKTPAAKERLKPALAPMNVEKTMAAPVTAILAADSDFHEKYGKLFPGRDMKPRFAAMPLAERESFAAMNATLQAAYFILAARSLGLDCGPMGGFDRPKVDAEFFADRPWKSILLVNLGHGNPSKLFPRLPRLDFAEAALVI